jgi:L-threonylcarbamoyladenylate synthase
MITKVIYTEEMPLNEISNNVISLIKNNELVITPTDTVHGFFCEWDNTVLEKKIRNVKNREEKPFIHLVNSKEMLEKYSSTKIPDDILSILPAPLTLIVRSAIIPTPDNSIALRFPDHELIGELIGRIGKPCISTSANISGDPMPENPNDLIHIFWGKCDLLVIDKQLGVVPSTILDIREKPYKIIRQGIVPVPKKITG